MTGTTRKENDENLKKSVSNICDSKGSYVFAGEIMEEGKGVGIQVISSCSRGFIMDLIMNLTEHIGMKLSPKDLLGMLKDSKPMSW
jgi:hypothetical protein